MKWVMHLSFFTVANGLIYHLKRYKLPLQFNSPFIQSEFLMVIMNLYKSYLVFEVLFFVFWATIVTFFTLVFLEVSFLATAGLSIIPASFL